MDTGELFQRLRVAKGLSQEQVAEKIGWSRQEIQRVESSGDSINVSKLKTALKGLDATLADLFESKVPTRYRDESHKELHDQLQEILESEAEDVAVKSAVAVTVKAFYSQLAKHKLEGPRHRAAAAGGGPPVTNRSKEDEPDIGARSKRSASS